MCSRKTLRPNVHFSVSYFLVCDLVLVAAGCKQEGEMILVWHLSRRVCQSPPSLAISWVCVSPLILIIRTEEGDDGRRGRREDTGEIDKSSGENIIR